MSLLKPAQSYRRVSLQTAPPGQLILMLFEGALRFLDQALTGFSKEDPLEFNLTISNNVIRAQDIVRELDRSLNMAAGGDLAIQLRRLYDYCDRRLTESNVKKDPTGIREVIERLGTLREAWAMMLRGETGAALPSMASQYAGARA